MTVSWNLVCFMTTEHPICTVYCGSTGVLEFIDSLLLTLELTKVVRKHNISSDQYSRWSVMVNKVLCSNNFITRSTFVTAHIFCIFIGCDRNYHKRCAYKIPNNCVRVTTEAHTNVLHAVNMSAPIPSRHIKEVWSGRPLLLDRSVQGRLQVPHTFFVHSFRKPTSCNHCKKLVSCKIIC